MERLGLKKISDTEYEGRRAFVISEFKAVKEESGFYISGYANTKNHADSYGDIPTNFEGQPVYDLSRIQKNPVMLMDHENEVHRIMGNFVELKEDEIGLSFRALLIPLDQCFTDELKQAVSNFMNGFARALSICGRFAFADPSNPAHLTKAYIHEISGVAVPADENSLVTSTSKPKSMSKTAKPSSVDVVEYLSSLYRVKQDDSILKTIQVVATTKEIQHA